MLISQDFFSIIISNFVEACRNYIFYFFKLNVEGSHRKSKRTNHDGESESDKNRSKRRRRNK